MPVFVFFRNLRNWLPISRRKSGVGILILKSVSFSQNPCSWPCPFLLVGLFCFYFHRDIKKLYFVTETPDSKNSILELPEKHVLIIRIEKFEKNFSCSKNVSGVPDPLSLSRFSQKLSFEKKN